MFSREDRILSELIVSRGLATPESVELLVREMQDSNENGLVEALVSKGDLDAETGSRLREEAREIDGLLSPELPEGRMLGEFRLLREIGRGGMGIVYEAEQALLGRRVALKVLPAGAALDERLSIRFLREARTAARLRHPGIVPVFGTGHEQGVLFFAMELVDGESLAARIGRGPVPPRETAEIAAQITEALQHAHEAGLVHRDVKPDNVILGADGRARLADFGLVHDLQGTRLTRSHYVLGTPAYSAPEQARGEPVDPRSDVYGAGAVIYAMLSGRPPFTGEVPAAVLGRLVNEAPPPLNEAAPGMPPELIAICERAMARDADHRYQTAGALAEALRRYLDGLPHDGASGAVPSGDAARVTPAARHAPGRVSVGSGSGAAPSAPPSRRLAGRVLAGVFVLVALVVVIPRVGLRNAENGGATTSRPQADAPPARAGLLRGAYRLFPTAPGPKPDIALSPGGQTLAYVSGPESGDLWIYLQRAGEPNARRLAPGAGPQQLPAWSPDGTRIAYCGGRLVAIAAVSSGAVESTGVACGGPMSWSPDGGRLVFGDREWPLTRLQVLDIASRTSHLISGPGTFQPSWGASGRIAYVATRAGQYDIWTVRGDGSDPQQVTKDTAREMSPVWSSIPGRLYYGSNHNEMYDLWEVDLDPDTGEVRSGPSRVSRGWFGNPFSLSSARNRERLAFVHDVVAARFWSLRLNARFEPSGAPQRLQLDQPFDARLPQRAPDREEWIAVVVRGTEETLHRFGPGENGSRVTDGPYHDGAPRWSPDGATIAFHSDRSGRSQIWTVRPDGTRMSQITRGPGEARFPVWSPDGRRLAYSVAGKGPYITSLAEREEHAIPLPDGLAGFAPWSWSGKGGHIAGTSQGIVILDLTRESYTRVTNFGERPLWVGDSTALLFTQEDRIFLWNGAGEPRAIWSTEPNRLASNLSIGLDGREIYFASAGSTERVWMLDLDSSVTE